MGQGVFVGHGVRVGKLVGVVVGVGVSVGVAVGGSGVAVGALGSGVAVATCPWDGWLIGGALDDTLPSTSR